MEKAISYRSGVDIRTVFFVYLHNRKSGSEQFYNNLNGVYNHVDRACSDSLYQQLRSLEEDREAFLEAVPKDKSGAFTAPLVTVGSRAVFSFNMDLESIRALIEEDAELSEFEFEDEVLNF